MKIVHFSAGRINPYAAKVGSVNVIYWLAQEQARLGHEVKVVVIPSKFDYENITDSEFDILEYRSASWKGLRLPNGLVSAISENRLKMDIAHLHGVYVPEMVAVSRLLKNHKIPYVVSTHGSLSPLILKKGDRLLKHLFKWMFADSYLRGAAFIHVHSSGEIRDAKAFGVNRPMVVAEHGFDWAFIPQEKLNSNWLAERYPQHAGAFKLLFLGRLDPRHKGLDLLIQGFSLAVNKCSETIVLFLVGPEKRRYKGEIQKLIKHLGLSEHVVLTGPLYDTVEKFSALSGADLFVLTSRYEGFPLTLFEAFACAKPVLVTPGTNAAEFVRDHELGWVCSPNQEFIAQCILEAYQERQTLREIGNRAKQSIKTFTWRRTAQILLKAYEGVRDNVKGARR